MKKVKGIICSLIFLTNITNLSATTSEPDRCANWAFEIMQIIEEDDQCFDAEDYNAAYNQLYQSCINRNNN